MARKYAELNDGVGALPVEEASADQLVALRAKLTADGVPYADFGLFRPHGARLGLCFTGYLFKRLEGLFFISISQDPDGPVHGLCSRG